MKEHPILFSAPMVRAILTGQKTQTRRVVKPQPAYVCSDWTFDAEPGDVVMYHWWPYRLRESRGRNKRAAGELTPVRIKCPYGQPGDMLWVRETWRLWDSKADSVIKGCLKEYDLDYLKTCYVEYRATTDHDEGPWRPSIYLPRWASRLILHVKDVRVERLQDISYEDAQAEGVDPSRFAELWNTINAKRGFGWENNPWVWVVTFKNLDIPTDL